MAELLLCMTDFLPSEERCAEVLRAARWSDGVYCLYCSSQNVVKNGLRPDHVQQYRCKSCGKAFNDRTQTIFAHTQMRLHECFYALKEFNNNRSTNQIRKELDRHWKTVNNLLKHAMASINPFRLVDNLEGEVEIDEVYINAGNKGTPQEEPRTRGLKMRGRGTYEKDRPPVIGLIERNGDMLLTCARHVDTQTIQHLTQWIDDNATVHTDEFRTYNTLKPRYNHKTVNHGDGEYAKENEAHVNTIEGLFSHLRGWLHTYKGVTKKYLQHYLNMFNFKHLYRHLTPIQQLNKLIIYSL